MNRRTFLSSSSLALFPLLFNSKLSAKDIPNDKSVIWIFLSGGISATEFINPVPEAPVEFRSTRGFVNTKSGYLLGGDFQKMAAISDKLTVVRNFHHRDANHASATQWVNTSKPAVPNQGQKWPSIGSVVIKKFGSNSPHNGIPHYVKLNKLEGDDAAFLGASFAGYDADQEGVKNMFPRIAENRFDTRVRLMKMIDEQTSQPSQNMYNSWSDIKSQSIEIIKGSASKAFDINLEREDWKRKFNIEKDGFGKQCLNAARMVEAGVKWVNISSGNWDNHSDISNAFDRQAPSLDSGIANLIENLEERGVLDKTLVVITSEFSRTPRINANSGRDHSPSLNTLVLAGGGINHGKVIGETDNKASVVIGKEYNPENLACSIFNWFNMGKDYTITDNSGRPQHLIPDKEFIF